MKPHQLALPEALTLQCGPASIAYTVIRSTRRRRTIGIRVDPERGVQISAPLHAPHGEIESVVQRRAGWILRLLQQPAPQQRQFVNGEPIPYLGRYLELRLHEPRTGEQHGVALIGGTVTVPITPGLPGPEHKQVVRHALEVWLREQSRAVLTERVAIFAKRLGVQPKDLHLGDQKSRWGSCSSKGVIRFNWRIVMAPPEVLDYLVVHELCHLLHLNHGKLFWARVSTLVPQYVQLRRRLLKEGASYRLA